jgi:hypothetical protein
MANDCEGVGRMTIVDPAGNDAQAGRHTQHPIVVADGLTLEARNAPCARCGGEVVVTVPWAWRTSVTPEGRIQLREFKAFARFGDPAWCRQCRLRLASTEETEWIVEGYREVLASATAASIPNGAAIWPIYFSADDSSCPERWRGFRGRFLAIVVSEIPRDIGEWPGLRTLGFPFGVFVIYQTRLWREGKPGEIVFMSNPARGEEILEVREWQQTRTTDLQSLMVGTELYRAVLRLGRRSGTGNYAPGEEAIFLANVERILTNHERDGIRIINAQMLADKLGIGRTQLFTMFTRVPASRERFHRHQQRSPGH